MSIYSVNILSVCLSVMLQKALLIMDVFILVFKSCLAPASSYYSTTGFSWLFLIVFFSWRKIEENLLEKKRKNINLILPFELYTFYLINNKNFIFDENIFLFHVNSFLFLSFLLNFTLSSYFFLSLSFFLRFRSLSKQLS